MSTDGQARNDQDSSKKSSLNEIIKSVISNKLNQYLGKYLVDIKKKDIEAKIGTHSGIILSNIQLRKDAFDDLRLPIEVDPKSVVRELRCELQMIPTQVHIYLKGVRVWVRPNNKTWSLEQWEEYKKKHLDDWEEAQKHLFQNLNLKSYKQRKLSMAANNINLTIEDIIIFYEDQTETSVPCAIRLRAEEFKIVTTSSDFLKEKICSSDAVTFRRIVLKEFSVAIKRRDGSDDFCEYSERMYVISPLSIVIRHTMIHKGTSDQPVHTFDAHITNLVLSLNDVQKQILEALSAQLNNQAMCKTYEENRPNSNEVLGNEQKWWNFLIKSCKKDMDLNFVGLIRNKRNMDKYIDYYKSCQNIIHAPWLRDCSDEKKGFLEQMEIEYSLEKIISLRTLALYQLRIEAMSYVKARGNVRGRTHLGDLWDYYLNDFESLLGDPYQKVAEECEIELSMTEKEELNHLLRLDELNIVNSYLNGTSSSRNDKLVKISLEIEQIRIFIQDTQGSYEEAFRVIPKNECLCLRCRDHSGKSNLNSPKFVENDGKAKVEGAVISINMIDSDGKSYDPQLVKESTLLIIESSLKGDFNLFRDMHLETGYNKEKLIMSNIEILDPLTLQDPSKNEHLKHNYGFNTAADLLENILEGNADHYTFILSLRFFLQEYNLIPEFEFLIHYKGLTEKNKNFCYCKSNANTLKGLKSDFFNKDKPLCLHMTSKQLEKYQKDGNLLELYNEILAMFQKRVMPRYLRNCIRWIIGNSIKHSSESKSNMKITIGWKGKSSPLQVQFNKSKRKIPENEFDKIFDIKKIRIRGELLEACISTDSVHSLIKWVIKPEEPFLYQNNFINSLSSSHPKIEYIKTVLKNIKKKGKQLYYLLSGKEKVINPEIEVLFEKVVITLMETAFSVGSIENTTTVIRLTKLHFKPQKNMADLSENSKQYEKNSGSSPASPRTKTIKAKDKNYYSASQLDISLAEIVSKENLVARIERFVLINKDCFMKGHPYLIDNIVELGILKLEINICEELLGFLGLVTTLDLTPVKRFSREKSEIKAMKQYVFYSDKKKLNKKLISCQRQHYKLNNLKKCSHCIISYMKVCKTFTFSIGQANDDGLGLEIKLYNFSNKEFISLKCQVMTGIAEEMIFSGKFSLYTSKFVSDKIMNIELFEKKEKWKFDPNEKSPLFTEDHHKQTSVPNQAVTCAKESLPLFLFLSTTNKKDMKIFDISKWKNQEAYFQANYLDCISKKLDLSYTDFKASEKKSIKRSNSYKKINIDYDTMKLNIHSIEFKADEIPQFPQIFGVIFSLVSFQQLFSKYQQCLYRNKQKRPTNIRNLIQINKVVIVSLCEGQEFSLNIEKILVRSLPTVKKTKVDYKFLQNYSGRNSADDRNLDLTDSEFRTSKKLESLEDSNFCYIDSVTVEIPSFLLKLSSFRVKTVNLVKQLKGSVNANSNLFTSILESVVTNKISVKKIKLIKDSQKIPLVSLPHKKDFNKNTGLECEIISKTVNLKQYREIKAEIFPLFLYVQSKNIVRLAKKLNVILKPLINHKVTSSLAGTENYVFFYLKFLKVLPYKVTIRFAKIYSELLLKKTVVSIIILKKLYLNNLEDFSVFQGKVASLKFLSNTEKYERILTPAITRDPILITFCLQPNLNLYQINIKNGKIIFLSKIIEENMHIINYITNKLKKEGKKEEGAASIKIVLESCSVLVPKSSLNDEFLYLDFEKAEIQTFSSQEMPWKLPEEHQYIEKYDKELSLVSSLKEKQVLCTSVLINLNHILIFHCDEKIGKVNCGSITVYMPQDPNTDSFVLMNKVNIELINAKLNVSIAKLKLIEDLVNTNMDEPLENTEKVLKSKNTKFKVKISSGKLEISRWVTKPWDNMKIISIKKDPQGAHKSLEPENFTIYSENEEQKSNSAILNSANPFDIALASERSIKSFVGSYTENNQSSKEFEETVGNYESDSSVDKDQKNFMT